MKTMQELQQSPETAGWLAVILYKFLPAGLGALIVIMVDPPKTKKDIFARFFSAFVCSATFGDIALELLQKNISWLSFLDPSRHSHTSAVNFIVGAFGWFVVGGAVMLAAKYRADPEAAVRNLRP